MLASKISSIGIVAPKNYRQFLGLTNIRLAFQKSFPQASVFYLGEADLRSMERLDTCGLVVLPPSTYGEDTPYKHYLKGAAAETLAEYAQFGRIASFCSGTWAILNKLSYTFNDGQKQDYRGYVPLIDLEGEGPINNSSVLRIETVFSDAALKKDPVNLCYDGGPAIKFDAANADPEVRPIAYFGDGSVSILAKRMSPARGIVVAFSSLADIQARDVPRLERFEEIGVRLRETEAAHNALWARTMGILETRDLNHGV